MEANGVERLNVIKELIVFSLGTTLAGLRVNTTGSDTEGEPLIVVITGLYGFNRKYNLEYEYAKLKKLQDKGDLNRYLLSVRESIINENN